MYPSRFPSASVLAPHETVIMLPPEILLGIVVGAVFVVIEPSSETKSEDGKIKAGRTPQELTAYQ